MIRSTTCTRLSVWRQGLEIERGVALDRRLDELLAQADVCIVGGEDHPGARLAAFGGGAAARHPRLVVLDIEGYPQGTSTPGDRRPMCSSRRVPACPYEHYSKRPLLMGFEPTSYGAALHGLSGLFAALIHRESTGRGQVVATSLFEGALGWTDAAVVRNAIADAGLRVS